MDFLTIIACSAVTIASATFICLEYAIEQNKYLNRKYKRIADLQSKLGLDVYDKYDFEKLSAKELAKLDDELTTALYNKRQSELDAENRRILENLL